MIKKRRFKQVNPHDYYITRSIAGTEVHRNRKTGHEFFYDFDRQRPVTVRRARRKK